MENNWLVVAALGTSRKSHDDVMCQNPGKDDHVILSPWHRENVPESPALIPEGLNTKYNKPSGPQTQSQHLTYKDEAQKGEQT